MFSREQDVAVTATFVAVHANDAVFGKYAAEAVRNVVSVKRGYR